MSRCRYYTLMASLPHLPHFEQAEYVPINVERLRQRRSMLTPDDDAQLARALALVSWRQQPANRTDAQVVAQFRTVMQHTANAALREFVGYRMGLRTVMAALRRKARNEQLPPPDVAWGTDPYARLVRNRWDAPDFGLRTIFPWLAEARGCLESGDALGLDRLLMDSVWRRLSWTAGEHPFGFEEVFAYVFKWDILDRWSSVDAEAAKDRFEELIVEVIGEHQKNFA